MGVMSLLPLGANETYFFSQTDITEELARREPMGTIIVAAMSALLDIAATAGVEVLRGPEVVEVHRPEYPGDAAWVRLAAVSRSTAAG